jgi:nitrogen fixation protein FixH
MRTDGHAQPAEEPARLKGHHVLLMVLAFFGVVFTVNGVFLASALTSYTGVVSNEPYVKGLKYNDRIRAGERQARLGWQEALTVETSGAVAVSFTDDGGRPVRGLKLFGSIGRPATNRLDRALVLAETEPGRYIASTGPLEEGTWLVALEATSGDFGPEPVYRLRRRVWLKR